ncbi:uncharacterized protein H6S33_009497 [Morchella sextelata]|uniref:uncharacterized protein n=1 Tax=Morchella sextelata TaxID=1174677 RepID=UPI001D039FE3|nr:uncharacterized protein H6S33_009497 [Morchella sextelata]KAH0613117.1 hypothetical protein H6S33_009497 [Morchella sextelata]
MRTRDAFLYMTAKNLLNSPVISKGGHYPNLLFDDYAGVGTETVFKGPPFDSWRWWLSSKIPISLTCYLETSCLDGESTSFLAPMELYIQVLECFKDSGCTITRNTSVVDVHSTSRVK